jgi:hypothetical protein
MKCRPRSPRSAAVLGPCFLPVQDASGVDGDGLPDGFRANAGIQELAQDAFVGNACCPASRGRCPRPFRRFERLKFHIRMPASVS